MRPLINFNAPITTRSSVPLARSILKKNVTPMRITSSSVFMPSSIVPNETPFKKYPNMSEATNPSMPKLIFLAVPITNMASIRSSDIVVINPISIVFLLV